MPVRATPRPSASSTPPRARKDRPPGGRARPSAKAPMPSQLTQAIARYLTINPKHQALMLTLTVKNMTAEKLRYWLDRLMNAFDASAGLIPSVSGAPRRTSTIAFMSKALKSAGASLSSLGFLDGSPQPP